MWKNNNGMKQRNKIEEWEEKNKNKQTEGIRF